jgi:hypothetical protein
VDSAFGALSLLTLHLTFRASTNGVAHGRARRVVALPTTSRVAILLALFSFRIDFSFGVDFHSDSRHDHNSQ